MNFKNKLVTLGLIGAISISSYFCSREPKYTKPSEITKEVVQEKREDSKLEKQVEVIIPLTVCCARADVFDTNFAYSYLWEKNRGIYIKWNRKSEEEFHNITPSSMIDDIYIIEDSCKARGINFAYIMGRDDTKYVYSSNAETLIQELKEIGILK